MVGNTPNDLCESNQSLGVMDRTAPLTNDSNVVKTENLLKTVEGVQNSSHYTNEQSERENNWKKQVEKPKEDKDELAAKYNE